MTVFNNNFIREYTHWEVSYDGIMTQIKCFIVIPMEEYM